MSYLSDNCNPNVSLSFDVLKPEYVLWDDDSRSLLGFHRLSTTDNRREAVHTAIAFGPGHLVLDKPNQVWAYATDSGISQARPIQPTGTLCGCNKAGHCQACYELGQ